MNINGLTLPLGEERQVFMRELIACMKAQDRHKVYFNAGGQLRERSHRQVHQDVLQAIATVDAAARALGVDTPLRAGAACVVTGASSYAWVLAALACFYRGAQVIAVPENLSPEEWAATTQGLHCEWVFADKAVRSRITLGAAHMPLENLGWSDAELDDAQLALAPSFSLVAFTSGTTAALRLKAFELHPEGTKFFADEFTKAFGLVEGDSWLVCSPFSHVVHFEYVIAGLLKGLNLQIVKPLDFVLNSRKFQPSAVVTVPAVYEQLAATLQSRVLRSRTGRWRLRCSQYVPERWLSLEPVRHLLRKVFPEVMEWTGGQLKVMIIGAAPSSRALKRQLAAMGLPLYEGYGMSEVGMILCNVPRGNLMGTVGKPFAGIQTRLADDKSLQILASFRRCTGYVNASAEENRAVFMDDGWIDTGDIVGVDRDGFHSILGRKKGIIVTDRGKKINPRPIEESLEASGSISHAILIGDNKPFLSVLVVPREGAPMDRVQEAVAQVNAGLNPDHRIMATVASAQVPTVDNGLLTRSGKIRRDAMMAVCRDQINAVYAVSGSMQ